MNNNHLGSKKNYHFLNTILLLFLSNRNSTSAKPSSTIVDGGNTSNFIFFPVSLFANGSKVKNEFSME